MRIEIRVDPEDELVDVVHAAHIAAMNTDERVWFIFNGRESYADPRDALWEIGNRYREASDG